MAPESPSARSHLSERSNGSASTLSFASSLSPQPQQPSTTTIMWTKSQPYHSHHPHDPNEFQITNVAAFEAATRDISQIIESQGYISSAQCAQIMQAKNHIAAMVQDHFPHSYSASEAMEKVLEALREHDCTPDNTLFAHSLCSDNPKDDTVEGSFTNVFTRQIRRGTRTKNKDGGDDIFQLGGLAGIPFAGKAGFNGFAHQAPENGHCFVLLAPHVGMDSDGTLGSCERDFDAKDENTNNSNDKEEERVQREEEETTPVVSVPCCAAAIDAFNYCCTHDQYPKLPTVPGNPEFTYLLHQLGPRHKMILAHEEQNAVQAELVRHCHEIAKGMLSSIVHTDFGGPKSRLIVLTGIQINMPGSFEDFFQPLSFYIVDKIGRTKDLFVQTFGHWSPLREKMKEKSTLMFFCT